VIDILIPCKPGISAAVMRKKIMMKRRIVTAPYTSVSMSAFLMVRFPQTLADNTPLNSDIIVAVKRHRLVNTPARRAVIDNNILTTLAAKAVLIVFRIAP